MPHKGRFNRIQQAHFQLFINTERQKKRKIKERQQIVFDGE